MGGERETYESSVNEDAHRPGENTLRHTEKYRDKGREGWKEKTDTEREAEYTH